MSTAVSSSTSTTATTVNSTTTSSDTSLSSLFTTLLVAQIRNQNPLEPTDPSEYVTQLAQLSQTESLESLVSQGSTTSSLLDSLQTTALGAQVGNSVTVSTDQVVLDGSTVVEGSVTLSSASTETTLVLTASDGSETRISLGNQAAGTVALSIDPSSLGLSAGTYELSVETSSGETPTPQINGTLTRVRLGTSSGVVLDVSGVGEVSPSAITAFNGS